MKYHSTFRLFVAPDFAREKTKIQNFNGRKKMIIFLCMDAKKKTF